MACPHHHLAQPWHRQSPLPTSTLCTWLLHSQSPPLPDSPCQLRPLLYLGSPLHVQHATHSSNTTRVLVTNKLFLAQHLPELDSHLLRCPLSKALIKCHFPEAHVSLISGTHITFCPVAQTGTLQVTPESSLPVPPVTNMSFPQQPSWLHHHTPGHCHCPLDTAAVPTLHMTATALLLKSAAPLLNTEMAHLMQPGAKPSSW